MTREQFLLDVLAGKIDVTEKVYQDFKWMYKAALTEGYYIGMRKGEMVISNKFPEKAVKQLADFDNFMKQTFTMVKYK